MEDLIYQAQLRMIEFYRGDVRRITHALKVFSYSKIISVGENFSSSENELVCLASIFHDIGIPAAEKKYKSSAARYQEELGPPIARDILIDLGLGKDSIGRICLLISLHHHYDALPERDFQALIEADFLVNAWEDHLTFSAISLFKKRYFKTKTGIRLLESQFPEMDI